jgi:hypothetical protein
MLSIRISYYLKKWFSRSCRRVQKSFRFSSSSTLLITLLGGGTVKNFIFVFVLVAMVGLVGCATPGKGQRASTGGVKLNQGNLQEMNITCFGYCSVRKDNSK